MHTDLILIYILQKKVITFIIKYVSVTEDMLNSDSRVFSLGGRPT